MATIVDKTACEAAGQDSDDSLLPANPYTALQFHFGMLLGVDDLETAQAYPRGKMRLHNAWLHREGVVWGFNVAFNARDELTVDPGLALDAAGHELHLDRQACLDLGQWYEAHKDDAGFAFADDPAGGKRFSVHVVAKFKACLTRPVPAMVEPCSGAQTDTAFSRAFETVELLLRPGLAKQKDRGYHRLRILFRIEPDAAGYADVQARRTAIEALPPEQQPAAYVDALREFAALDVIDLKPQVATASLAASIFPEDPTEVVLADVADILVQADAGGRWHAAAPLPAPAVTVRPSHIATATVQELLCGPLFAAAAAPAPAPGPAPDPPPAPTPPPAPEPAPAPPPEPEPAPGPPPAPAPAPAPAPRPLPAGPVVIEAKLSEASITLAVSRPLAPATLAAAAFTVSALDPEKGWSTLAVRSVKPDGASGVRIDFKGAATAGPVRLIARGTGPAPLLAADDLLPLGAAARDADDGVDFVKMFANRS